MSRRFEFRPKVTELGDVEPAHALRALRTHERLFLLDSAHGRPRRHSLLAFDPLAADLPSEPTLAALRPWMSQLRLAGGDALPEPFHGGFLGALSYDLGVAGERPVQTAPEPWGFPDVVGGLYVDFIVRDEAARKSWLVLGDSPGDGRAAVEERRARVLDELAHPPPPGEWRGSELERCVSSGEHVDRVERCRQLIARGDLYQANLAHRFVARAHGDPLDGYARLREVNPAPYMCFARWPGAALLSASPELLLEYDGELARTRPIKGTAPRSDDERGDRAAAEGLLASAKDRAELAMIVDLERNDLARVCSARGVWVEGFPRLESYARVHHLMADVVGRPRAGVDAFHLLAALFPGGSVTGAPKLRAMEVIAELEGERRGFFCGSAGYVDLRGRTTWNILIRTLLWRENARRGGELSFRVGGGVTWPSRAEDEDRETLDKARGLMDALERPGSSRRIR